MNSLYQPWFVASEDDDELDEKGPVPMVGHSDDGYLDGWQPDYNNPFRPGEESSVAYVDDCDDDPECAWCGDTIAPDDPDDDPEWHTITRGTEQFCNRYCWEGHLEDEDTEPAAATTTPSYTPPPIPTPDRIIAPALAPPEPFYKPTPRTGLSINAMSTIALAVLIVIILAVAITRGGDSNPYPDEDVEYCDRGLGVTGC